MIVKVNRLETGSVLSDRDPISRALLFLKSPCNCRLRILIMTLLNSCKTMLTCCIKMIEIRLMRNDDRTALQSELPTF